MTDKNLTCSDCSCKAFSIEATSRMVGDDRPVIEALVCRECGAEHDTTPSPTFVVAADQ